jgi:hypothetical protein
VQSKAITDKNGGFFDNIGPKRIRSLICSRSMKALRERRIQRKATGEIRMGSSDDWKTAVRRNKLLGMWTAEKLGIAGREAEVYSDALAVGTLDPERSDVLSKIRRDFDAAGVTQSDEQILHVMNELVLQAGSQM